jgi:hypothetical protein
MTLSQGESYFEPSQIDDNGRRVVQYRSESRTTKWLRRLIQRGAIIEALQEGFGIFGSLLRFDVLDFYPGLLRVPNLDKILGKFRDYGEDKIRLLPIVIKTEEFSGITERVKCIADILVRFYD